MKRAGQIMTGSPTHRSNKAPGLRRVLKFSTRLLRFGGKSQFGGTKPISHNEPCRAGTHHPKNAGGRSTWEIVKERDVAGGGPEPRPKKETSGTKPIGIADSASARFQCYTQWMQPIGQGLCIQCALGCYWGRITGFGKDCRSWGTRIAAFLGPIRRFGE